MKKFDCFLIIALITFVLVYFYLFTLYGDSVTRCKILRNILFLYTVIIEIMFFQKKIFFQITEMEQQILKAINHIKYCISSNKCPRCLLNFENARCGAY